MQRERVASRIYAYNTIPYNTMPSHTHATRSVTRKERIDAFAEQPPEPRALVKRTRLRIVERVSVLPNEPKMGRNN